MARRSVVILKCDRCGKEEETTSSQPTGGDKSVVFVESMLHEPGISRRYSDLCNSCTRSLKALLDKIFMDKKEKADKE